MTRLMDRWILVLCLGATVVSVTVSLAALRMVYDTRSTHERLISHIDETHEQLSLQMSAHSELSSDRMQVLSDRIRDRDADYARLSRQVEQATVGRAEKNATPSTEPAATGLDTRVLGATRFLTIEDLTEEESRRIDKQAVLFERNDDGSMLFGLTLSTRDGALKVTADNAELVEMLMEVEVGLRRSWNEHFERKLDSGECRFFKTDERDQLAQYLKEIGAYREIKTTDSGHTVADMSDWNDTEQSMQLNDDKSALMSELGISDSILWSIGVE